MVFEEIMDSRTTFNMSKGSISKVFLKQVGLQRAWSEVPTTLSLPLPPLLPPPCISSSTPPPPDILSQLGLCSLLIAVFFFGRKGAPTPNHCDMRDVHTPNRATGEERGTSPLRWSFFSSKRTTPFFCGLRLWMLCFGRARQRGPGTTTRPPNISIHFLNPGVGPLMVALLAVDTPAHFLAVAKVSPCSHPGENSRLSVHLLAKSPNLAAMLVWEWLALPAFATPAFQDFSAGKSYSGGAAPGHCRPSCGVGFPKVLRLD